VRTDRQKIDLLFGKVSALHFHTIRCDICLGRKRFGDKKHLSELVAEIQKLYDCLDEPPALEGKPYKEEKL